MRLILTAVLFVVGLLMAINGVSFLASPHMIAPGFGLSPEGPMGWAAVRADMTAFFLVSGLSMMWGAWRRAGDVLLIPAILCGVAFAGRLVSAIADGTYDHFWLPMLGEALVVVISIAGNRLLPHHKVEEIAG